MPPIPVLNEEGQSLILSKSSNFDESDNLSVSSVTRRLSLLNSSSGEQHQPFTEPENLIPSGTQKPDIFTYLFVRYFACC